MTDGYSYIGRAPCGCARAACVDNPARKRGVAKSVGEMVRNGLTVERVPNDVVRNDPTWKGCPQCDPKRQKELIGTG